MSSTTQSHCSLPAPVGMMPVFILRTVCRRLFSRKFATRILNNERQNSDECRFERVFEVSRTASLISAFTLVEVMISIGVFALMVSGLFISQMQINRFAAKARDLNSVQTILRNASDRFQTVAKGDSMLNATSGFQQIGTPVIYDEDPEANAGAGTTWKMMGILERKVTYVYGSATSDPAFATATFRVRWSADASGNMTKSHDISTNRATP